MNIIPVDHPLSEQFIEIAESSKIIVFSGLPGVGKSLYINAFEDISHKLGKEIDMIQWDVARKAFETEFINAKYPMGDGIVNNGVKLIAGTWLINYIKEWINKNSENNKLLVIEAPLVGNRFSELIHKNKDSSLENYLASDNTKIVVPIPTKKVRRKIEMERARQVKEDAKVWSGAKPSVMLMLWKDTCKIANEFGMDIDLSEQPSYSDGIYEYVYSQILRHRNFEALIIDEIFEIPEMEEDALHKDESIRASEEEANKIAQSIMNNYSDSEINDIVDNWYRT